VHVFVAAIIGKVGLLALEDVVLHLLDSKCMSIILYAVELCHLSQSDIRSLDLAIFSFFMKLLQTKKQRCYKWWLLLFLKFQNGQVNVWTIAKPDLTRHSVNIEIIVKCLRCKYCTRMWNMCLLHYYFLFSCVVFSLHGWIAFHCNRLWGV